MTTPTALHSAKTPKWGTPSHIVELARELMGYIHLDPASSEEFNAIVRALMIYTERDNGLAPECEWHGNIFLNPPGGLVRQFWRKLVECFVKHRSVQKAVWVGFSVEQLCQLADETLHPMDFSLCILRKRLNFTKEDLTEGSSPSHGNYVCAMGCDPAEFERLFKPLGRIYHGKVSDFSKENLDKYSGIS